MSLLLRLTDLTDRQKELANNMITHFAKDHKENNNDIEATVLDWKMGLIRELELGNAYLALNKDNGSISYVPHAKLDELDDELWEIYDCTDFAWGETIDNDGQ